MMKTHFIYPFHFDISYPFTHFGIYSKKDDNDRKMIENSEKANNSVNMLVCQWNEFLFFEFEIKNFQLLLSHCCCCWITGLFLVLDRSTMAIFFLIDVCVICYDFFCFCDTVVEIHRAATAFDILN